MSSVKLSGSSLGGHNMRQPPQVRRDTNSSSIVQSSPNAFSFDVWGKYNHEVWCVRLHDRNMQMSHEGKVELLWLWAYIWGEGRLMWRLMSWRTWWGNNRRQYANEYNDICKPCPEDSCLHGCAEGWPTDNKLTTVCKWDYWDTVRI